MIVKSILNSKNKTYTKKLVQLECLPTQHVVESVLSFAELLPGMIVKAKIIYDLDNGFVVSFLGFLYGTIDFMHMSNWDVDTKRTEKNNNSNDQELPMNVCILHIDRNSKNIALSCIDSLVQFNKDREQNIPSIIKNIVGSSFSNAVIKRIDRNNKIYLHIPKALPINNSEEISNNSSESDLIEDNQFYRAYVRLAFNNENQQTSRQRFKVGQIIDCRVKSYSPVDDILDVTLSNNDEFQSLLNIDDLQIGSKIRVKILEIRDDKLIVALNENLQGYIPHKHTSDVIITDLHNRFKVGQHLDVRIWNIDQEHSLQPRIILTNKRSLVHSQSPPSITKLEDLKVGLIAHGIVTGSDNTKGLFITFFGNISGLVNKMDLLSLGIQDPSEVFQVSICFINFYINFLHSLVKICK